MQNSLIIILDWMEIMFYLADDFAKAMETSVCDPEPIMI